MKEIDEQRRVVMKGAMAAGVMSVALSTGLLVPRIVLAAWPQAAFLSENFDKARTAITEGVAPQASDRVRIAVPDVAENGAQVPVEVTTDLDKVEKIVVMVEKNPRPMVAEYVLGEGCEPYVSVRVKVAESGPVVALVYAGGKVYSAQKSVTVAIGGCG